MGFAPVNDPRIAFAVVVENGGYGRAVAGPVCREIVKAALQ
ncbi:MAG: penicillin-binding transpeptidase domain-containing protein [Armatimonadetes bacterium]|nr:penicillin-binding transpeptidase domain-containing protein [Armatimonadota bacterium]